MVCRLDGTTAPKRRRAGERLNDGNLDRLRPVLINIPQALDRLCYRYPSMLVDAITEHEAGRRLVAVKNVTVNEEFFQGHFPGRAADAGVLMLESLSQVAAILLLAARGRPAERARLPARRQRREVPQAGRARRSAAARDLARQAPRRRSPARRRRPISTIRSSPSASCCSGWSPTRTEIDPTAIVHPSAPDRRGHRPSVRTPSIGAARPDRRRTARSAPRRSSTAGPRSATAPRSIRSRRSAWFRRT